MALTELACRHAKPKAKPYKLTDGEGLYLLVKTNGSKLWQMAYRFGEKQKTLSFGPYPTVTMTEARDRRIRARRLLEKGVDPGAAKKQAEAERETLPTFKEVALDWLAGKAKVWSAGHMARVSSRLVEDVYPAIGDEPISLIKSPDVLAMLRAVEDRGALDVAKRIRQTVSKIFRYAIARDQAEADPASYLNEAMKQKPRVKHRAALKARDLPDFLGKLAEYDGEPMTQLALDFTLSTFVRTGETRFAAKSEFEGLDTSAPLWRIPAERMKMHREHLVPLSPRAVGILRRASALAKQLGVDSDLVFPGKSRSGAMSENTMLYACYRMGFHGRMTVHGLRSTASTILNENGFNRDWIELQLAHTEDDEVRAAYNAAEWLPQRREMMIWWGAYLDRQAEVAALLS